MAETSPRTTVRDIARQTGVHFTTVGRALRNDPRVRKATAERIRAAAQTLGYAPDPMISALCAYRRKKRTLSSFQGKLAWISNGPTRDHWQRWPCYRLYREGAEDRAREHGYLLENFWLKEPGMTALRANRILTHRGIRGLLISPLISSRGHLSLAWEEFSTVAFGYSMVRPKVHRVTAAHYRSMIGTLRHLRSLGFKRIGYVETRAQEERLDFHPSAAYLADAHQRPASETIPVLNDSHLTKEVFMKWFREHRPQAILTTGHWAAETLRHEGYRVPEEVCVANPGLQEIPTWEQERNFCGFVEPSREIGQRAVDLLIGMLQRGERGIPEKPLHQLIEGRWTDGESGIPPQPFNPNSLANSA